MALQSFGDLVKEWRSRRRISQLDLALGCGVSARHLSYLETGKAFPSREMVLKLCEGLFIPKPVRNTFLIAAGYAPIYHARALDSTELAPFIQAVTRLLDRHTPFPGWALDSEWRIVQTNPAGEKLLAQFGVKSGESLVEALVDDPTCAGVLVNWRETVFHLAARLNSEARRRNDAKTAALARRLSAHSASQTEQAVETLPAAVPIELHYEGRTLSLISVQALFNTAEDLTLADLRIELFFPASAEPSLVF